MTVHGDIIAWHYFHEISAEHGLLDLTSSKRLDHFLIPEQLTEIEYFIEDHTDKVRKRTTSVYRGGAFNNLDRPG